MERVDVTILGRDYSLACSAEEKPTLLAAVRHVDQLMLRIQGTGKVSSNERIGDFKRRIEDMNAVLDDALSGQEKLL
jgi:cell division protein ZapA